MTHFRLPFVAMIVAAALLTGCASQAQVDRLQKLYRKCEEQKIELQGQLEECKARIVALQNAPRPQDPTLVLQVQQLTAQRDQLAAKIQQLEQQIRDLAKAPLILPPEIDDALKALAAQHGDVMTYDAAKGMVKLRSDLTFALGSAKISPQAADTLGKLAAILQQVVNKGYELRVVGHTDNVPIRRAATRQAHPTNWHLSVHRAIAVRSVLEKAGVPPVRIQVAGHGEHRPVAQNGARGNEANRRVEIYIERATYVADPALAPAPAASSTTSDEVPPAVTPDTSTTTPVPVIDVTPPATTGGSTGSSVPDPFK